VRIIFVSKGFRYLAPLLGFFEVFIWLLAMTKILQNLDRWYYYLAYCAGFATGNFIGILLEEKIAIGYAALRLITKKPAHDLIKALQNQGYGVTYQPAEGSTGLVHVVYTIVKRSELNSVISTVNEFNPRAFFTVEEVKVVREGIQRVTNYQKNVLFKRGRKGK
ncbi:MAG: DUF5698 domain-containing protein, partial [Bacteroidales bacterium]